MEDIGSTAPAAAVTAAPTTAAAAGHPAAPAQRAHAARSIEGWRQQFTPDAEVICEINSGALVDSAFTIQWVVA